MITLEQQTTDGVDKYMLLDSGEIPEMVNNTPDYFRSKITNTTGWYGEAYEDFIKHIRIGDENRVKNSDKFLDEIEDQVPMSLGWRNIDDVVGAVPNVPSFLAGHPQCMRRRERVMRETSPLVIYMDLTSSGGINSDSVERRGIVLLALTRRLVEHRAVELWVGTSLGTHRVSGTTAWRIDTAPMDLARAAFYISATVMSRGFGYAVCQSKMQTSGNWPFSSYDKHCVTAAERLKSVFSGRELLYVPPIYLRDEMTSNPVGWVKRVLAQYTKEENE